MFEKFKYFMIVLLGCAFFFMGCTEGSSISLEEALVLVDNLENPREDIREESADVREEPLFVYVCGAVMYPGVYELEAGSRIVAAIEAAGGFSEDAAEETINLAEHISDGMQIIVQTKEQADALQYVKEMQKSGRINLNTATVEDLCALNGIGESKAEAIIAYRMEIGAYKSIEQLKEVTGIGESLFNKIKSSVYIE